MMFRRFSMTPAKGDTETVTRDEFVRRCVESGMTPADAELQVNLALVLGSTVTVGDKRLKVE